MTNREKGRKLIDQAGQILKRDLTSALQAEDFNLAIRRAQEVIELATKGALQILGVDYPKIHNVGAVLIDQARAKKCPMDEATLTKIEEASGWLASLRNTAFYVEETYSAEEAGRACEEAKFVYAAIEDHFKL